MNQTWLIVLAFVVALGLLLGAILAPVPSPAPVNGTDSSPATEVAALPGMIWVPGGTFTMGTNELPPPDAENPNRIKTDEYPAHDVELGGYWMDETPVTNAQFAEFVAMTGHITFAEQTPTREDFARSGIDASQIPENKLKPGSICFNRNFNRDELIRDVPGWEYQVWEVVDGADWRHPEGPRSSIDDRMDHPVVHVNWEDAQAYCLWAGKRLPTEAEFEYAARNGGEEVLYPWGNELTPQGKYLANFWQGEFPDNRLVEDGFLTSSPVRAFPPNKLGLYDMAGNVWQWCHDRYHERYYEVSARLNPQGPSESFDPTEPGIEKRSQRGGSFMCNTNNCTGYRCTARMRGEFTSSSFHNGFRCVVDTPGLATYRQAQATIAAWRAEQGK